MTIHCVGTVGLDRIRVWSRVTARVKIRDRIRCTTRVTARVRIRDRIRCLIRVTAKVRIIIVVE